MSFTFTAYARSNYKTRPKRTDSFVSGNDRFDRRSIVRSVGFVLPNCDSTSLGKAIFQRYVTRSTFQVHALKAWKFDSSTRLCSRKVSNFWKMSNLSARKGRRRSSCNSKEDSIRNLTSAWAMAWISRGYRVFRWLRIYQSRIHDRWMWMGSATGGWCQSESERVIYI